MGRVAGTLAANFLSGVAWVVSHIVYGVLKIRYHRDLKILAIFVATGLAIAALLRWVF